MKSTETALLKVVNDLFLSLNKGNISVLTNFNHYWKCSNSLQTVCEEYGLTLDCHLTMNAHVSYIARTCYFELHRLASIRTATATLVSAFALSIIDYCNSLLFGSTHDVTSHLQRIQYYAAPVILRLPKSSNIDTHLRSLHWLPVKVRST